MTSYKIKNNWKNNHLLCRFSALKTIKTKDILKTVVYKKMFPTKDLQKMYF
jgi:uncharacterized protein YrrD